MQTADKNGIICDFCAVVVRQDFTYFSLDIRKVKQYNGRRPEIYQILGTMVDKSYDICTGCYDDISKQVVDIYSRNMNNKTGLQKHFCELSSVNLQPSSIYYYCVFSKVVVKTTNCFISCTRCGKIGVKGKVCKCGSSDYTNQAVVQSFPRELEINISNAIYDEWVIKASRPLQDTAWSSTS